MNTIRKCPLVVAAAICLIAGCATLDPVPTTNTVELRATDEGWIVSFNFKEPQKAVILTQAPEPYRVDSWSPRTPGVSIQQFGEADFIVFEEPARTATFSIEPTTRSIRKAYTPFLSFTDGGWGVLEGQFRFAPVDSLESAEAYGGNGETWPEENADYALVLRSDRNIYQGGQVVSSPLELTPEGDGRYIYIGDRDFEVANNYFGVVDRGLPEWIRDQLDDDLSLIFAQLTEEWGMDLPERAEILFVYDGADHPGLSQTGGAFDVYYACGDLIGLMTEAESTQGDIFDFWTGFLATARDQHSGAISAELYFEQAEAMGVPETSIDWMRRFVFEPVEAPRETILERLSDIGLRATVEENGALVMENLPD